MHEKQNTTHKNVDSEKLKEELEGISLSKKRIFEDTKNTQETLVLAIQKGATNEDLLKLGFSEEEIVNAREGKERYTPLTTETKKVTLSDTEKIQSIADTISEINTVAESKKALQNKLVAIKLARAKLLQAEKVAEKTPEEELQPTFVKEDSEKSLSELTRERDILEEKLERSFSAWGAKKVKTRLDELDKLIEQAREEKFGEKTREIKADMKERPFLYYVAQRAENIKKLLTNPEVGTIDLSWSRFWPNNKEAFDAGYDNLITTGENEGFFEMNIFGFTKVIKNVKELKTNDGIDSTSEDAIYKIVGPDGTIVADNIKGYSEATKIFDEASSQYKEKSQEEFDTLNTK